MSKLIAITGMDGVGKNSVIDALLKEYPSSTTAEIWQPMFGKLSPFSSKRAVDEYLCGLNSRSRTLFLTHALMESTLNAIASQKEYVFLNAYYYKYFVSELTLGTDRDFIQKMVELFPKPDYCIQLTAPITQILNRKTSYSHYECGMNPPSRYTFEAFQNLCTSNWAIFNNSFDLIVENTGSISETVAKIKQYLDHQ